MASNNNTNISPVPISIGRLVSERNFRTMAVLLLAVYLIISLQIDWVRGRYALALAAPVILAVFASIACIRAGLRTGIRPWLAMGVASGAYAAACTLAALGHSDVVPGMTVQVWAGIAYTTATLAYITALYTFAFPSARGIPGITLADAGLIAASCLAVCWCVFLGPMMTADAVSRHIHLFDFIYLLGDAFLVLGSMALAHRPGGQCQPVASAVRIAVAMIMLVTGDALDLCSLKMAWGSGFTLAGILWLVAFSEIYVAAGRAQTMSSADAGMREAPIGPAWSFATTAFTITATALILLCEIASHGSVGRTSLLLASALVVAYLVRQWAGMFQVNRLLRENLAYSDRLRNFNNELEDQVEQRTRYLKALHTITADTKATLDVDQVLRVCLTGTIDALGADGGCILIDSAEEPAIVIGDATPITNLHNRMQAWRKDRSVSGVRLDHGYHSLFSMTHSERTAPATLVVWRRGERFTDIEHDLADSVSMELESALHNARIHEEAAAAADCDPLTGLLNHRAMQQRLSAEISRSSRDSRPLAMVMMDLNDFKIFNDTFGHPVGDDVLRHVADTLRACTREFDLVARYGGDEFALILPGADHEVANRIAERICNSLYTNGIRCEAGDVPLRISYGVAVCPDDAMNRQDLLALADAALYRAKQHHRTPDAASRRLRKDLDSIPSFQMLDALISALDQRDRYTRRHCEDVTVYALTMAKALGWPEDDIRAVRIAGLVHDVGKVGIPEHLLRKPGAFSAEEHESMRRHPEIGCMLARSLNVGTSVEDAIRYHHERWDGGGYPAGLKGDAIPAIARLLAVADAFSAMTTHRPYRRALASEEAIRILRDGAGSQWDPAMVAIFEMVWSGDSLVSASCGARG